MAKRLGDPRIHTVEIGQHLVIPESQNAITFSLQKCGSLTLLRRRVIVLAAVDLDDQRRLVAHEIGDVAANRHLAAEFEPLHLLRAQDLPNLSFCVGHVSSQAASAGIGTGRRVFLHVLAFARGNITVSACPVRFVTSAVPNG